MAGHTNKEAKEKIRELLKKIRKKFNIEKAILFGSRAREDWLKTSDIDLILVSKDFKKLAFKKRMQEILGHWNEEIDLEVICYTPEEFERKKKQIGLVQKAVEEGKIIEPAKNH
ncbi:MAG: nucleotidyltransferase domain-containing protein [Candidatus Pacearchaeota archaeon]